LAGVTKHQPTVVADLDGVVVRVWRVGGVQAREIANAAGDGPLYIADGHHRYETATTLRGEMEGADRIPALVVPAGDPGLIVLPTHRIIEGAPVDPQRCVKEWQGRFAVEERESEFDVQGLLDGLGANPAAAVAFPGGKLIALAARSATDELEIAVIEREVVQALARAAGARARVTHTAAAGEVLDAVARGAAAGVLLRPTPTERVLAVADAGGVLPPKSTYFAPKVPSGLVVLPFAGVDGAPGAS
jgi:uncharacterized protein (DUF1015 family)